MLLFFLTIRGNGIVEVVGSIPIGSTIKTPWETKGFCPFWTISCSRSSWLTVLKLCLHQLPIVVYVLNRPTLIVGAALEVLHPGEARGMGDSPAQQSATRAALKSGGALAGCHQTTPPEA